MNLFEVKSGHKINTNIKQLTEAGVLNFKGSHKFQID